jgi:hypothetical protein
MGTWVIAVIYPGIGLMKKMHETPIIGGKRPCFADFPLHQPIEIDMFVLVRYPFLLVQIPRIPRCLLGWQSVIASLVTVYNGFPSVLATTTRITCPCHGWCWNSAPSASNHVAVQSSYSGLVVGGCWW